MSGEGEGGMGASQMGMLQSDIHAKSHGGKKGGPMPITDIVLKGLGTHSLIDAVLGNPDAATRSIIESLMPRGAGDIMHFSPAIASSWLAFKEANQVLQGFNHTQGFTVTPPKVTAELSEAMHSEGVSAPQHAYPSDLSQLHPDPTPAHAMSRGQEQGGGYSHGEE